MHGVDIGDDRHVGRGDPGQRPDLAGRAHAHLEDGGVVAGPKPQEREGQAEVVVEVPLAFQDVVARREEGGGEVLGRGLARRSR